jgi:hypothetical protein
MSRPHDPSWPGEAVPENPGRRRILISAGLASAAGALLPWGKIAHAQAPAPASPAELEAFHALGQRLTGHDDLPRDVSARLYAALARGNRAYAAQASALASALDKAGIDTMARFQGSAVESDATLKATAMAIISGWYLGYTGEPLDHLAQDDTQFITYQGALMFEPTRDATVIPTYARAGTNYWSEPPPGLTRT